MDYPNIIAAVPKGEHFDASAVNEGVWISQAHLDSIENTMASSTTAITGHDAIVSGLNASNTQLTTELATTNQTIVARDASIVAKDAEIAKLKASAAAPLSSTSAEQDDLNDTTNTVVESETTKEANRLRAIRDGKK